MAGRPDEFCTSVRVVSRSLGRRLDPRRLESRRPSAAPASPPCKRFTLVGTPAAAHKGRRDGEKIGHRERLEGSLIEPTGWAPARGRGRVICVLNSIELMFPKSACSSPPPCRRLSDCAISFERPRVGERAPPRLICNIKSLGEPAELANPLHQPRADQSGQPVGPRSWRPRVGLARSRKDISWARATGAGGEFALAWRLLFVCSRIPGAPQVRQSRARSAWETREARRGFSATIKVIIRSARARRLRLSWAWPAGRAQKD